MCVYILKALSSSSGLEEMRKTARRLSQDTWSDSLCIDCDLVAFNTPRLEGIKKATENLG